MIAVGAYPSWRWLTIACLVTSRISVTNIFNHSLTQVMCLLWVVLIFFIPESPVHFITRKQYAEAREALEWLRGTNEVRAWCVYYKGYSGLVTSLWGCLG